MCRPASSDKPLPHSRAAPIKTRHHAGRMMFPTDLSTCSVHNLPKRRRPKSQKGLTGLCKRADHVKRVRAAQVIHIGRGRYIVQQTLVRQALAMGSASSVRATVDKLCRPEAPGRFADRRRNCTPTGERRPKTPVHERLTLEHARSTVGVEPLRAEDDPQTVAFGCLSSKFSTSDNRLPPSDSGASA